MIVNEELCLELKKAQLSLVNETDTDIDIEYTWEHIPEKLSPGHRQRGKERTELHCLPFRILKDGKYVYSHWDGNTFINKVPIWTPKLHNYFSEIVKLWITKSKWKWHVNENKEDIFNDGYLFLLRRAAMLDLNKYNNPVPQFLFWLSNQSKLVSKNYFSCAGLSIDEIGDDKIDYSELDF